MGFVIDKGFDPFTTPNLAIPLYSAYIMSRQMKNFLHILIPLLIIALHSSSCEKQEPEPEPQEPTLPPLTHEGKNTFGCKVNGEVWLPEIEPSWWESELGATYDELDGGFDLVAKFDNAQGHREFINVYSQFSTEGTYEMPDEGTDVVGFDEDGSTECDYYYDLNNLGIITITHLDTSNNIVSGKFEMDLINPNCIKDTMMSITEGRFDVRY